MFVLKKTMEIAGAHRLSLPYDSKCRNIHGHNWKITIWCQCEDEDLDENEMVVDFTEIKRIVGQMDHTFLNSTLIQPTAERIAKYIGDKISGCHRVDVEESEGNMVSWVHDGSLVNGVVIP